jgi:hypothetical protein
MILSSKLRLKARAITWMERSVNAQVLVLWKRCQQHAWTQSKPAHNTAHSAAATLHMAGDLPQEILALLCARLGCDPPSSLATA